MSGVKFILVGEGDFSFANSVRADSFYSSVGLIASEIVATSLDSFDEVVSKYPHFSPRAKNVRFMYGVDVLDISTMESLCGESACALVWNHPHLGVEDAVLHAELMVHLWYTMSALLHVKHVFLSFIPGQFDRWKVGESTRDFTLCKRWDLDPTQFPGFVPRRNFSGTNFKNTHAQPTAEIVSEFYYFVRNTHERRECVDHTFVESTTHERSDCVNVGVIAQFECNTCGKTFRSAQGLGTHTRQVHELNKYSDETLVECHLCGKSFKGAIHLEKHIRGIHVESKPGKSVSTDVQTQMCAICKSTRHTEFVTRKVPESFPCESCPRIFRELRAVTQHCLQVHTNK